MPVSSGRSIRLGHVEIPGVLLSLNLASEAIPVPHGPGWTGIGKQPVTRPVQVRDPGPKRRDHPHPNGLEGDTIMDTPSHGGTDQAVYAYAREDLDWWEQELGYDLPPGRFGENLTTQGIDVTNTLLGEQWRIGDTVVLQATSPRIPCATFAYRMGEPKWVKRFTAHGAVGAYLRVVVPGEIRAGDRIEIIRRPQHSITIGHAFRALTTQAELLPSLLEAGDDLPEEERQVVLRRTTGA
jgi:MOSC domain-containing protein YiiM